MNGWLFLLRNIRFFSRSWALTLAGSIIGTAVLTGALITGDSVRHSLYGMVDQRLGSTTMALTTGDRYVRKELARDLSIASGNRIAPALILQAMASNPDENLSLSRIQLAGIDSSFLRIWSDNEPQKQVALPGEDGALISSSLSRRLNLEAGDAIVIRIHQAGFAPHNAPFVSDQAEVTGFRLTVHAIIPDDLGGKFSLANNQSAPYNLFMRLDILAGKAGLPGVVNTLLIADPDPDPNPQKWGRILQNSWLAPDAGLYYSNPDQGEIQVNSKRIFIDKVLTEAIQGHTPYASPIITYLVNDITANSRHTPYSFVTASDNAPGGIRMAPGEMVVTDWLADDLGAGPGDTVRIRYWTVGVNRTLREAQAEFRIRAVTRLTESPSLKALMPDFPGMSESGSCRDWESGVPVDLDKIRDKDENYWKQYKGSPKAWISWQDGLRLWENRFGQVTAFRIKQPFDIQKLDTIVKQVDPASVGLSFRAVRKEGITAALQSTDFGELFLSLGGLVVISGLLLSGMMFALFLRTRYAEVSLLLSMGFRMTKIRKLYLSEMILISIPGGIMGVTLAIGYATLIIGGLNTLWQGAVQTDGLVLHITGMALIAGFLSGFLLNIALFSRLIYRLSKSMTSTGSLLPSRPLTMKGGLRWTLTAVFMVFLVTALSLVAQEIGRNRLFPSVTFVTSGLLLMTAMFGSLFLFITRKREFTALVTLKDFGLKNLSLKPASNMATIMLLALGIFAIMVAGTNRRSGEFANPGRSSGTGGFHWWMETTLPLPDDLNRREGLKKAGLSDEAIWQGSRFLMLPVVSGDDASCLNLNRVARPSLLGVPAATFDSLQSFSFVSLAADGDQDHPWRLLNMQHNDSVINGYADQTVITWGLGLSTGDTLFYTDEGGKSLKIRIAGGLDHSIFQGYLLVSDSILRAKYPSLARSFVSLIETAQPAGDSPGQLLTNRFSGLGAEVISTSERLQGFNIVENTYLSVFMVLGGFGILLGTAGLAVIILKNLNDRREEFSLYLALGFPTRFISRILLTEYGFILTAGVITGAFSAMWASLPLWWGSGWPSLLFPGTIVIVVFSAGYGWIGWVVRREVTSWTTDKKPGVV